MFYAYGVNSLSLPSDTVNILSDNLFRNIIMSVIVSRVIVRWNMDTHDLPCDLVSTYVILCIKNMYRYPSLVKM